MDDISVILYSSDNLMNRPNFERVILNHIGNCNQLLWSMSDTKELFLKTQELRTFPKFVYEGSNKSIDK